MWVLETPAEGLHPRPSKRELWVSEFGQCIRQSVLSNHLNKRPSEPLKLEHAQPGYVVKKEIKNSQIARCFRNLIRAQCFCISRSVRNCAGTSRRRTVPQCKLRTCCRCMSAQLRAWELFPLCRGETRTRCLERIAHVCTDSSPPL